MKRRIIWSTLIVTAMLLSISRTPTLAQCPFVSGGTGLDGAFAPTTDRTLPLPPDGIFNFTTVNIPSGVTVRFQKNAKNTPVFILATGGVTIAGTIDVSGGNGSVGSEVGRGGPGAFDGGFGGVDCGGGGFGPGGGSPGCGAGGNPGAEGGGGGGFGSPGGSSTTSTALQGGQVYGNARLSPLVGGSGGGGGKGATRIGLAGGGGGGAILIASSGTIDLSGLVVSMGGRSFCCNGCNPEEGGSGSGGAIRLMANLIAGPLSGTVSAEGGSRCYGGVGGSGRVRLEACEITYRGTFPPYATLGSPSPVVLAELPTLSITSVGGVAAPTNPAGSFLLPPDVSLPAGTMTATVNLAATRIPTGTTVAVTVTPVRGLPMTAMSTPLSGTQDTSTATADISLPEGVSIITAQTTVTVAQAGSPPIVIGSIAGEKIEKVRVAVTFGGPSSLTYITASGREIPAERAVLQ